MILKRSRVWILLLVVLALTLSVNFAALAQTSGQTLTWSIEGVSDLVSLDPAAASDSQGFTVINLLYGGLVRLDGQLHVAADLADFCEVQLSYAIGVAQPISVMVR